MHNLFPIRQIWRGLGLLRWTGLAGLLLLAMPGLARGQATDYIYYSGDNNYRYDNLSGTWAVDDGGWTALDGAPDDSGLLESGDNWSNVNFGGITYEYDSVFNVWYTVVYDNGVDRGYAPCADPSGDTDYIHYENGSEGTAYLYDNLTGKWAAYASTDYTNYWSTLSGPPTSSGIITSGDNWTYSQVGDGQYAYDGIIDTWYLYNVGTGGWSSTSDPHPTDFDYYYAINASAYYRYDNLSGLWYSSANGSGNWQLLASAPSAPGILTGGAHWVDHPLGGAQYAYDSVIATWYAYNPGSNSWSTCADPTQGGTVHGNLTVGSLLVDYDAEVAGSFFVNNDFSIGGAPFDPSGLVALSDSNGNFLGWQLVYGGIQNGSDASFSSLAVTQGISVGELYGNVSVAGSIGLGVWNNGTQNFTGVFLHEAALIAASPAAIWHWRQNGASAPADQMTFDYSANLNLFSLNGSTSHTLTLSPAALSLFTQVNNEAVHAVSLINDSVPASTLVLNLGDGIYLDSTNRSMRLGNATITGSDSAGALVFTDANSSRTIAIGPASQSLVFSNGFSLLGNNTSTRMQIGSTALALGGNATASGSNAVALAGGAATGVSSMAMGGNSTASGNGALTIGADSVATGNSSIAMTGGNASGDNAIAIGPGTSAQTRGTVVVGHYNAPISGNATSYSSGDPAFIVGIGTNATTPANAFVIYNNGDAQANGNVTLTNPSYVAPNSATQPQEMQVNGSAIFNGSATLNGVVIISTPQGGLPMGAFGN